MFSTSKNVIPARPFNDLQKHWGVEAFCITGLSIKKANQMITRNLFEN
jgi:hypothetical protein